MPGPRAVDFPIALSLSLATLAAACGRPGGPDLAGRPDNPDALERVTTPLACAPVQSSEPLPARSTLTGAAPGTATASAYLTADLYQQDFNGVCGGCHFKGSNYLSVSGETFTDVITPQVIDRITSDDPLVYMPPPPVGIAYSKRDPTDPVVKLVGLLRAWLAQGKPPNQFTLTGEDPGGQGDGDGRAPDAGVDAGDDPTANADLDAGLPAAAADSGDGPAPGPGLVDYGISPRLGAQLTNIGSCVPSQGIVAVNPQTMDDLDAMFAGATELPRTLAETDLVTFDSDTLARDGVVSYAPAYPLWSDDAGKMRHVRVPHGTSISFDPQTQRFQIPPNTRFYKTFLKKVIDASGNEAYRKIETRLIVSRPDQTLGDGTVGHTALFGTYLWNADETTAELWQTRLNNGQPNTFKDRLLSYYVDEPRAQEIIDTNPRNLDYTLQIENPGVLRHYAIPGSERCIECHMGSPSADFVLGFTPLQVARPAQGQGGIIEPATGDELTQLQRLIDYGVITGISSAADVTPLEESQGARAPRNGYELAAQAYLLGNCSHCHNPRGFPSTKAPELKEVLNFLPGSAPEAGIFQFPLDRMSPVRVRGARQDVSIPYITPSLRDLPGVDARYPPKYETCVEGRQADGWCTKKNQTVDFIDAPWRSLIYRNVDTPFDYVDDFTIFPHMPLNTPGYDCRAARILGDWMVSIPATRVNGDTQEDAVTGNGVDTAPQPYREVTPDDPLYPTAQSDAQERLDSYHAGHRYGFCPTTVDIVDPAVLYGDRQTPADVPIYAQANTTSTATSTATSTTTSTTSSSTTADATGGSGDGSSPTTPTVPQLVMPREGVPDRAHFVVTDATDPPGDWYPRGSNWPTALLAHQAVNAALDGDPVGLANLQTVIDRLQDVSLGDPIYDALTTEIPFGLWKQKPGCDFAGIPTAGSYQGQARPLWMDRIKADPGAPVYLQTPGAAVFANICINCHGPQADARGLLADEISIMTGGLARVANFRAGLFGPVGGEGANRERVFGLAALTAASAALKAGDHPDLTWQYDDGTPADYGARYLAWMALGGTQKVLPPSLLQIVASTPVLGVSRGQLEPKGSPNMLQLVQELCTHVLLSNTNAHSVDLGSFFASRTIDWSTRTALIGDNGDAELWLGLCSLGNRPVVRVPIPFKGNGTWVDFVKNQGQPGDVSIQFDRSLFWGADVQPGSAEIPYPTNAKVMNHRGDLETGLQPDNLFPICVQEPPAGSDEHQAADGFLQAHPVGGAGGSVIPYCPPQLFETATDPDTGLSFRKWQLAYTKAEEGVQYTDANTWAVKGAINAGIAVFKYVDQLSRGLVAAKPRYNQCELLSPGGGP